MATRGDQVDEEAPPAQPRTKRQWRRPIVITLALLSLLALVAAGGWAYVRTQYYVGADHGQVVVFRGVSGSVAGVSLHTLDRRTDLQLADLTPDYQDKVNEGIGATSSDNADVIVQRLRDDACTAAKQAQPRPTPTPSGARRHASPSPAPEPAVCAGATP
jgi:protein phosphatase